MPNTIFHPIDTHHRVDEQSGRIFKAYPVHIVKATDEGIVEAFVSVMGNIDYQWDIIDRGAFAKTIAERASKIRVLDNHNYWSVEDVCGKMLQIREVGREDLPAEMLVNFPDASGALWTQTQFWLDDDKSRRVFKRIKERAVDEYSIGFEIIKAEWETVNTDEGEVSIRRIKEIKLYEYSPVIFAANPATATADVKAEVPTSSTNGIIPKKISADNYREASDQYKCRNCIFYREISDEMGYCKHHDDIAGALMVCDAYEPTDEMLSTLGNDLYDRMMEALETCRDNWFKGGYTTEEEDARLAALVAPMCDGIVNMLPDDLRSKVKREPEPLTLPKSEQPEADPNGVTSTVDNRTVQRLITDIKLRQLNVSKSK